MYFCCSEWISQMLSCLLARIPDAPRTHTAERWRAWGSCPGQVCGRPYARQPHERDRLEGWCWESLGALRGASGSPRSRLVQCLAHNRCSINVCGWVKQWTITQSPGVTLDEGSNGPLEYGPNDDHMIIDISELSCEARHRTSSRATLFVARLTSTSFRPSWSFVTSLPDSTLFKSRESFQRLSLIPTMVKG